MRTYATCMNDIFCTYVPSIYVSFAKNMLTTYASHSEWHINAPWKLSSTLVWVFSPGTTTCMRLERDIVHMCPGEHMCAICWKHAKCLLRVSQNYLKRIFQRERWCRTRPNIGTGISGSYRVGHPVLDYAAPTSAQLVTTFGCERASQARCSFNGLNTIDSDPPPSPFLYIR
jgi:hypothetical protein